jgi:hypothetical protein
MVGAARVKNAMASNGMRILDLFILMDFGFPKPLYGIHGVKVFYGLLSLGCPPILLRKLPDKQKWLSGKSLHL